MSDYKSLEKVIASLKSNETKNFVELDSVFEKIVNNNPRDLIQSIELIEKFLAEELDKKAPEIAA